MKLNSWKLWLGLYSLLLLVYAIYSYSMTAPNLVLSSNPVYWRFQTYMWETFFNNRPLLTYTYVVLITMIFGVYYILIKRITDCGLRVSNRKSYFVNRIIVVLLAIAPLVLAINALSYDVFSYIFNAKMVTYYHANPHVSVALDYYYDDWTRFMHNTHTPAPYGYGWTVLSLLPYSLGLGKFLLTLISFQLFGVVSYLLLVVSYWKSKLKTNNQQLIAVLANPLLLIEVIGYFHNDLWMLIPAIFSFLLIKDMPNTRYEIRKIVLSLLLLLISISIKLVTVVLLPLWLLIIFYPYIRKLLNWYAGRLVDLVVNNWSLVASLLLFIPLLTVRSQQFHPWYLTWVLVWLPFIDQQKTPQRTTRNEQRISDYGLWIPKLFDFAKPIWINSILVLSFSSMLRYLPYLWYGEHTDYSLMLQKLITWIPFIVFLILESGKKLVKQINE